jgi:hypothetical protein
MDMRINKRFSLILLVLCFTIPGGSTLLRAQTFSGMLVAGFNLSQIDGDRLGGFNKLGINTGARVSARLTDRWHLSTEFLYSQQGANRVITDDISSIYDRIQLNFVEVPFMVNFSDWKILASAGVSYNRLINYEVIDNLGTDITQLENYREDLAALVFGATYFFSEKWALNIRWSKHLTSMKEKDPMAVEPQNFVGRSLGIRMYFIL